MSSSSAWEPYPSIGNTPRTGSNPMSGSSSISPIVTHSNGPGGGGPPVSNESSRVQGTVHHSPPPAYSSAGPPPSYIRHPYVQPLGPGNPYPPGPPVIYPYPPPPSTVGGSPPGPYNHHGANPQPHPHFSGQPPPGYPPIHGHGPPISPTHMHPNPPTTSVQPVVTATPTPVIHHSGPGQNPPYNMKTMPIPVPQAGMQQHPHPHGHIAGPLGPQTPIGPPAGGNPFSATNPELDLHPELVNIGWRKFWSKRENRWYFWNCHNNESLWEMPPLPGRHHPPGHGQPGFDSMTDPLGITGNGPAHLAGLKRRSSSGEHLQQPVKRFILSGPWDLEISSNAYSSESAIPNPHFLPPHPEIELMRYQLVVKLRQCYQQSCQSREGIDAPKESLNKWFVERRMHDHKRVDAIFPSCDETDGVVSQVMFKEIMNDIPIKIVKPRFTGDARKQLSKYADACKKIIETRNASAEARKLVKWKVEETISWLRSTSNAPFEAIQERLQHLKATCQPHVHEAAKSSVEGICKKMSVLAKQYAGNVKEAHLKLFVDPDAVKQDTKPEIGRFRCHPFVCGPYSFTDAGKLPQIEFMQQDRDRILLKFKNDVVRLSTQYLQKMEQLYRYNCVDDRKFEFFLARCYCLLKRYNGFCEDYVSPHSTQGALPVTVFESIQRNFGVTFECFASPLNSYFRQYCSAFPDTDGYFGSRGSFLDFKPVGGSFQMNPPHIEDLIDSAITHVEDLLGATKDALSFIIFVPDFTEEKEGENDSEVECSWLKRMDNSRWNRKKIVIASFEHDFRHGSQHLVSKDEVSLKAPHATVIYWLQNDAGFDEWNPSDQKIDSLTDAYRPGRERERDRQDLLAPERKNPQPADKAVAAAMASTMTA